MHTEKVYLSSKLMLVLNVGSVFRFLFKIYLFF